MLPWKVSKLRLFFLLVTANMQMKEYGTLVE